MERLNSGCSAETAGSGLVSDGKPSRSSEIPADASVSMRFLEERLDKCLGTDFPPILNRSPAGALKYPPHGGSDDGFYYRG